MNQFTEQQIPYVAYVLKRYPRFSETFVVNEILAHERAGTRIDIFALGPVQETHFQDGISQVRAPVTRLNNKQHKPEAVWEKIKEGFSTLPHFAENLAKSECNIHELTQSIEIALEI
ncbi:hypothetical protein [Haemophilus pittmaniae]|uniref:hypothetical protein n=1 Tax=Haemophilus pittmaniae TaxID=249188 RepID=UPI0028DC40BF|nr:hypothetical protein [Haemophilus pittmaniae]